MVKKAQMNKLFTGLADHLIPNGMAILQYVDYTILSIL
jgi:hypothetical protein